MQFNPCNPDQRVVQTIGFDNTSDAKKKMSLYHTLSLDNVLAISSAARMPDS